MRDILSTVSARGRRTPHGCRTHGFTLIELMLVVTVVGILASVAIPSVTRARAASLEVSTIGTLRALNNAQMSYATTCAGGNYAPTVVSLSTPPGTSKNAFIGPGFTANTFNRAGYQIVFSAGARVPTARASCNGIAAGQTVASYFVAANPATSGTGAPIRYFGTSGGATIFQSTIRVPVFLTGVPPAPAKPVQ